MLSKTLSTSSKRAALHREVPRLAEFCQALYDLLVAHADDFGRLQGDPFTVKHAIEPTSPRKLPDFERALGALNNVGLIVWYEAEGRKYIEISNFDPHQTGLHKRTESKFPEPPGTSGKGPPELKRTEEKRREEEKGAVAPAPSALVEAWNQIAREKGLRVCQGLSGERLSSARARLREYPDLSYWRTVCSRIAASAFCGGQNDRGWLADFDFLVRRSTHLKVMEGKYDDRKPTRLAERCSPIPDADATSAMLRQLKAVP